MNMKRSVFIAGIFGIARVSAQQWKDCVREKDNANLCSAKNKPALKDQCPVCGTVADPYRVKQTIHSFNTRRCDSPKLDPFIVCTTPNYGPVPDPIVIRCKTCNAAFWQDPEVTK